jgi:small-conductance mechanosensitive channel
LFARLPFSSATFAFIVKSSPHPASTKCNLEVGPYVSSFRKKRRRTWGILLVLFVVSPVFLGASSNVFVPAEQLIQFLNESIGLYHQTTIQQQSASDPQEQLLLYDEQQLASESVRLAFEFARGQLDVLSAQAHASPAPSSGEASSQYDSLREMLVRLDKQIQDTQTESDSDRQELSTAAGAKRARLQAKISELQGEIALAEARRDAVQSMLDFLGGSAASNLTASGLRAQIEALASSVPGVSSNTSTPGQVGTVTQPFSASKVQAAPSGIWGLASDLFALFSKLRTINSLTADTNALLETSSKLRVPFVDQLRNLSKQGDQLAARADSAGPATLASEREQLDAIAAQFKNLASAVSPLAKQRVLLNLYQRNLSLWRDSVYGRCKSDLVNLGIRLGALALLLALLNALSEVWRRSVYRYVHDPRRRNQFLLLRKVTLWCVIALIVLLTFASKLGSFFTFAGLLTAGVAVALQNVILAAVGYFFLIGKFGIRIGDRIEVNGITGEVIDIGLVRFHLMELGAGATPTGRVVAFSNSVVFQAASGLFKQIPGAAFAWHQVTLTVPRDADFGAINKSLLGAAENVLRDYQESIEGSYHQMEKTGILVSDRALRPKLELHLSSQGIDATILYPVDLQNAADIDARVSRELLTALERDSKLQTSEGPTVHLKTDVPAATPSS